jgi:hypothetical protein
MDLKDLYREVILDQTGAHVTSAGSIPPIPRPTGTTRCAAIACIFPCAWTEIA